MMMTDKTMIKTLANFDGFNPRLFVETAPACGSLEPRYIEQHPKGGGRPVPDYLNSHDAIQRVINGLNDDELCDYSEMLSLDVMKFNVISWKDHRATARQKCEGVLRAKRLWGC